MTSITRLIFLSIKSSGFLSGVKITYLQVPNFLRCQTKNANGFTDRFSNHCYVGRHYIFFTDCVPFCSFLREVGRLGVFGVGILLLTLKKAPPFFFRSRAEEKHESTSLAEQHNYSSASLNAMLYRILRVASNRERPLLL